MKQRILGFIGLGLFLVLFTAISPTVFVAEAQVPGGKWLVCGSLGDVNGDGTISQADITLARSIILGVSTSTDAQRARGDVNGSNSLTTLDIALINRYLLGLSSTFPGCPSITVLSPNGGESWPLGSFTTLKWKANGMPSNGRIEVYLQSDGNFGRDWFIVNVSGDTCLFRDDNGVTTSKCIDVNAGEARVYLPATDYTGKYKIRVSCFIPGGNSYCTPDLRNEDSSDSSFYITASATSPLPSISVLFPNGGEELERGKSYAVKWLNTGLASQDLLAVYLIDSAGGKIRIGYLNNADTLNWTVNSYLPLGSYKVSICTEYPGTGCTTGIGDESDSYFTITASTASLQ